MVKANKDRQAAMQFNAGPNQSRKMVPVNNRANLVKEAALHAAPYVVTYATNQAQKLMNRLPPVSPIEVEYREIKKSKQSSFLDMVNEGIERAFKGKIKGNPSGSTAYGLSKAPNPKKVRLNSGIIPNTFSQDYMAAVDGVCSPMHISGATLQIPTDSRESLNSYFLNTVAFDIQTRAQSNVGFDLLSGSNFTASNILSSTNAVIRALSIYYWFTSIISYESLPSNKNEAMLSLRQSITSDQLNLITQLGRRLEDTPVPPRLVEWVKFMSHTYFSGDSQGSALIKICPNLTLITGGNTVAVEILQSCINGLSTATATTVFTLLRRAVPQWRIGKLYDVTSIPAFDPNFLTIFSNLPNCVYSGSASIQYPIPVSVGASVSYNSFTNKLDGVAFSCTSVYNTSTSTFTPGLVSSNAADLGVGASLLSSRLSWTNLSGVLAWRNSNLNSFNTASRSDTYQFYTSTPTTPHLYGSDKCQNVNATALIQSASNTLDFLFDVDSIPTKNIINSFNSKSGK